MLVLATVYEQRQTAPNSTGRITLHSSRATPCIVAQDTILYHPPITQRPLLQSSLFIVKYPLKSQEGQYLKLCVGCRVYGLYSLSLLNLTQLWNFLNAPLGSNVAYFTASICLYPRRLRAYRKPQAGINPPRRSPLVCCIMLARLQNAPPFLAHEKHYFGLENRRQYLNCCKGITIRF